MDWTYHPLPLIWIASNHRDISLSYAKSRNGFWARPESHLAPRVVDTRVTDGKNSIVIGFDAIWVRNRLALGSEYFHAFVSQNAGDALVFLLPMKKGSAISSMRHLSLIVFCILAYSVTPVAGFGWLLVGGPAALLSLPQVAWLLAEGGVGFIRWHPGWMSASEEGFGVLRFAGFWLLELGPARQEATDP